MTDKAKREAPLKVPMAFDEAMKRVLQVKPPKEGWKEYEKKTKKDRKKRRQKKAA